MRKNLSVLERGRDPRVLLRALRSGAAWFQSNLSSGVDTSAGLLQVTRSRDGGTPYCFLVINPDTEARLGPFHFQLHENDVEFHELRNGTEALDDTLTREVMEKLTSGRFELVVVLGVVNGPSSRAGASAETSWWKRLLGAVFTDVPRAERQLVLYRERMLQVSAMAEALRMRCPSGRHRGRIIEALHDWSALHSYWDVAGTLQRKAARSAEEPTPLALPARPRALRRG